LGAAPAVRLEVDPVTSVGTIVLDRPPLNALDSAMWQALAAIVEQLHGRSDVRALVLCGSSRALAAGSDVRELAHWEPSDARAAATVMHAVLNGIASLPVVTIAVVSGYALGVGCELALACDLRFAADNAKIGQPEVLLGLLPGAGGTQRLPRLIGAGRAKELIFSGRMVDMVEAPRIGLVDRVLPADDVMPAALAAAAAYAAGPASLALAKRAIDEGLELPLADGLALERQLFAAAFETEDARVGIASFDANGPGAAEFRGR
jgi:enoyl-CoA hydratase/carnithine racemase